MVRIKELSKHEGQVVTLKGWVANKRTSGKVAFLVVRDGSGFAQCIVSIENVAEEKLDLAKKLTLESAVILTGEVVKDTKQIGGYELQVKTIELVHKAEEYPIAKKEHGVDFLMNNRHLWLRSKKPWATLSIRNRLKFAIHTFFQEQGFIQTDAPLLTGNACEGTTTLFETDFYKKNVAYLSQSGQLYAEAMAMGFGKVYTFGPTFRAEKSVTPRHLSEFWMIEPEMAFCDLEMDMQLIEEFIKYIVTDIYQNCKTELEILERDTTVFQNIQARSFPRMTYDQAVRLIKGQEDWEGKNALALLEEDLKKVKEQIITTKADIEKTETTLAGGGLKKGKRNYFKNKVAVLKVELKKLEDQARNIPQWIASATHFIPGDDFGASDEKALTRLFDIPIMVYNWPRAIKAFYMKRCEDNPEYVKGVDVLAPEGFGEIVGGSERETDLQALVQGIESHNLPMEAFEWYLDLRRYGSVPHAGFGLGFERLIMWLTNAQHIRETIPFPRYYGRLFP